MLMLELISH